MDTTGAARRHSTRIDAAGIRRPQELGNSTERARGNSDYEDCALLCATAKFATGARSPRWSSRDSAEWRRSLSTDDCGTRRKLNRKAAGLHKSVGRIADFP